MFRGSFTYNLDAKGRISIPAKLRKHVSSESRDTFIMTRGTEHCIDIYPLDEWEKFEKQLLEKRFFDPEVDSFSRLLLEHAQDDTMDAQSRILVPQKLLEFAKIEKEVLILGVLKKIELWNPDQFAAYKKKQTDDFPNLAFKVMAR